MPAEIDLNELLANAVHFGHRKQKWNPKMRRFIYTEQEGIHIFDLAKTAAYLENALQFLKQEVSRGKIILFVCTKPQASHIISESAQRCGMPYVTEKWIPGLLTNYATISKRINYLRSLKEQEKSGEFEKYTKKEAGTLKKTIVKLERALGGVQNMTRIPDMLFVVDVVRDKLAIKEAKRVSIPVMAVVDSNGDPDLVDYVIPGNDDAVKSIEYLVGKVEETIVSAKGKKV